MAIHLYTGSSNMSVYCTCVPEGSSLVGLLTVGPTEGGESGGGCLSTTRGLLEAEVFEAAADVGENDISTNTIRVHACVLACVCTCACVWCEHNIHHYP